MKGQGLVLIGILAGVPSVSAVAAGNDGVKNTTVNTFSLQLGATRLIYDPDASGETLTIFNHQDYPVLVQSEVLKEDRTGGAPFVVTPPLFRLDGQQSSRLRIIRTGGNFPTDRESLQWLCVKSVPPRAEDKWAEEQDEKGGG
ncbi:fimbria/pilus periplasmic chaperone, partial [Escherichia coli]|nr:fimbria/pilus periplasmic chaperone [Escherichia coli]